MEEEKCASPTRSTHKPLPPRNSSVSRWRAFGASAVGPPATSPSARHLETEEFRGGKGLWVERVGLAHFSSSSGLCTICLLYTSPSPRDRQKSRMPSSA